MSGPRVAMVLAAGGITGVAFHGGALAGLEAATGWDPRRAEVTVGTSAGSMTGAMLRLGVPTSDLLARATGALLSAASQRIFDRVVATPGASAGPIEFPTFSLPTRFGPADPAALGRALLSRSPNRRTAMIAAAMPEGSVDTSEMRSGLGAVFGDRWPAGLWVCAVRISDGELVVFGRDRSDVPAADAIAASCAIPGFFKPVTIDGERHVDGGIRSLANADLVAGGEFDLVIVSSPMTFDPALPPAQAALLSGPLRQRLRREVRKIRRGGTPVLVIEPNASLRATMGGNPMDPSRRLTVTTAAHAHFSSTLTKAGASQLPDDSQAALAMLRNW